MTLMSKAKQRPGVGFGVLLLKDGKFLLGRRHADPTKADSELHGEGTWTMPGGKLEFGESFEDGARREVMEETGITIDPTKLKLVSVSNDKVVDAHFVTIGFLCEDFEGEAQVKEPDEITEWRWFPVNDPPAPLFFPSERVLKHYLARTIY
jgi:8-oxo-dGTP diphosphatase